MLSRNEESSAPLLEGRIRAETVRALAQSLFKPAEVAHVFLCGPGSMIKEVRTALFDAGVPRERVHHEFFAAGGGAFRGKGASTASGARDTPTPDPSPQGGGEIRGSATGPGETEVVAILDGIRHRFTMPADGSVVDAALAAGLRVPYSCKGGMCCTCRAKLVEGEASMRVNYSLEPWEMERGFILTCQAVPKSAHIVLDYDAM